MTKVVLDASALLALLRAEPGADVVNAALAGALMSSVNYSEVLKKTLERGGSVKSTANFIQGLTVVIVPFDEAHAVAAAELYPEGKAHGMSFADRACLSLGVLRGAKVLTAERKMALVSLPIKVKLIRHAH